MLMCYCLSCVIAYIRCSLYELVIMTLYIWRNTSMGVTVCVKSLFPLNKILPVNDFFWKFAYGPYGDISLLLHLFRMISYSASPRTRSYEKGVITYIYLIKRKRTP